MSRAVRTLLFVPGNRPERFDKALASGADAIVLDLEDAVGAADKPAARAAVAAWLAAQAGQPPAARVLVRINGRHTPWFAEDVQACAQAGLRDWMLPKAESADDLAQLPAGSQHWPLIESAPGLAHAEAIARAPGVQHLVFGSLDFQADLGMDADADETELAPYRAQLVLASRLAGVGAPVDGVTVALDDPAVVTRAVHRALRQGFGAKLCIHPKQVAVVHDALHPGAAAVAQAQRVLAAAQAAGGGAVALDGVMVDRPVILRAQAVLARAGLTEFSLESTT